MKLSNEVKYSKSHEWVQVIDETTVRIGISDYAQDQLGNIVFVNLPEEGDEVTMGDTLLDVESVKAVSDLYSPVTGIIKAVNEELLDAPEAINAEPYEAWFVEIGEVSETAELLSAEEYQAYCDGLE